MPTNVVFLGAPGAGKGTQAKVFQERYGYRQLSTGEILRDHCRRGTALGRAADGYMQRGELVPDDLIVQMVRRELPPANEGIIFDGFPRTTEQARALDDMLAKRGYGLPVAIYFSVDEREAEERMLKRSRADDDPEVIRRRFQVFEAQRDAVERYYKEPSHRFHVIDASKPVEAVTKEIEDLLALRPSPSVTP